MNACARRYTMRIYTGNAAFDGCLERAEIARILRAAADRLEREAPPSPGSAPGWILRDSNGNPVGDLTADWIDP